MLSTTVGMTGRRLQCGERRKLRGDLVGMTMVELADRLPSLCQGKRKGGPYKEGLHRYAVSIIVGARVEWIDPQGWICRCWVEGSLERLVGKLDRMVVRNRPVESRARGLGLGLGWNVWSA